MKIPLFEKIINFVENLTNFAIKIGIAISVLSIIVIGYRYFTSKEIKKEHSLLIFVVLGILVILLVFDFRNLIKEILGK